jgi:hypothetical protein
VGVRGAHTPDSGRHRAASIELWKEHVLKESAGVNAELRKNWPKSRGKAEICQFGGPSIQHFTDNLA